MNIVDILIIGFLAFGAFLGIRRGFTKQLLSCVGVILVLVLSFVLKNPVSVFLYENLPFFKFGGMFKGVTVLNILVYEVLAFFLAMAILIVVLKILLFASGIFEKLLSMTIILGIPSKILGALLGVLENFIITFAVLYILALPNFNISSVRTSYLSNLILTKTPFISSKIDSSIKVIDKFVDLKDKYKEAESPNEFNLEALDLLLEYKIVTVDSVEKLLEKNKLDIEHVDTVLDKYREG